MPLDINTSISQEQPLLVLENLRSDLSSPPCSMTLSSGQMIILLAPKEEFHHALMGVMLGLNKQLSGQISLFGQQLFHLSEKEACALRQRIGSISASGGLISNLEVMENILLPTLYHRGISAETRKQATEVLARVEYSGSATMLSGLLNIFHRKQIAMARAILMNPDLMIYDSLIAGLNPEESDLLLNIAKEFHHEKPGRCSLFLTTNQALPSLLPDAINISLTKGSLS